MDFFGVLAKKKKKAGKTRSNGLLAKHDKNTEAKNLVNRKFSALNSDLDINTGST